MREWSGDLSGLGGEKLDGNLDVQAVTPRLWNIVIRRIVQRIADLGAAEREAALSQLLIVAGLRHLEEAVEQEAAKMPILNDIREHKVLGREFKKGELTVLRRLIEKRFGTIPTWANDILANRTAAELEELSVRILDAKSLEDLLK